MRCISREYARVVSTLDQLPNERSHLRSRRTVNQDSHRLCSEARTSTTDVEQNDAMRCPRRGIPDDVNAPVTLTLPSTQAAHLNAGALLRHVTLDVGEDGVEPRFVADRVEVRVVVAVITPQRTTPAGPLRFA